MANLTPTGEATAASVKAVAMRIDNDAKILDQEREQNILMSRHLKMAAMFLEIVEELETAGVNHSDAMMIANLIMERKREWESQY